jgi:cation diffusion facilitator family transporter
MNIDINKRAFLTRFAWLSIAAAVVTIAMKSTAYLLTGSVGLLSDAMESLVNLMGALMSLAMLTIAARPADEEHSFGHSKAEYFSSGFEGILILIAAGSIAVTAVQRFLNPQPLEQLGLGLLVSVGASLVNLGVALVLNRASKKHNSITLKASAHHLLTDVWTSGGVLVGVGAVALTGWQQLDPIVALLVAANIVWSGVQIVRQSVKGLMDVAWPTEEMEKLQQILNKYTQQDIQFHALRTRQSGARRFVSFHVLIPGDWTIHQGHQLLEKIEAELRQNISSVTVTTHMEPLDDPAALNDTALDRDES